MNKATEIFVKHWEKATSTPCDNYILEKMKYCIDAIDEALKTHTKKNNYVVTIVFCRQNFDTMTITLSKKTAAANVFEALGAVLYTHYKEYTKLSISNITCVLVE